MTLTEEPLKLVIVGHVDHGKSTLIGRLLTETDSIPKSRIESVKMNCADKGKEFEHAFLLDAFQEEQEQGITIDTTKIEFKTSKRRYTIIDAPGHKEFLKNMISGASNADAAVLIIDADEGVREQTKKHAYLLSLMGIKQTQVVINKMDLVNYSKERFDEVTSDALAYLGMLNVKPSCIIPISGRYGDNITSRSGSMSWYDGPTVLGALDRFEGAEHLGDLPLRFPIQDVYKFDHRRIIVGRLESGSISVGDEVVIFPSKNKARIRSIERWNGDAPNTEHAGASIGVTIDDELFLTRGEVITMPDSRPMISNFFKCHVFWMGHQDLVMDKKYRIKLHTQDVECELHTINKVIDADTLKTITSKTSLSKNDVGTIVIKTKSPIVFDAFETIPTTGRFVIVDGFDVCGGGIIEQSAEELSARENIETKSRFVSPKTSLIKQGERNARYGHKGLVVWITGLPGCGKEDIAKQLERALFDANKNVYHMDASNIRLGLSADLTFSEDSRHEHTRRLAEVANLLYHAGFIVIVSVVSPFRKDRAYARGIIGEGTFLEVFVDAPLEICKERNPHGIYSRAEKGELLSVPGVNFSYEHSTYLTFTLHNDGASIQDQVKKLAEVIDSNV